MNFGKILQVAILIISVQFSVTAILKTSLLSAIHQHIYYLSVVSKPINEDAALSLVLGASECTLLIEAAKAKNDFYMTESANEILRDLTLHINYQKKINPSPYKDVFFNPQNWLFAGNFTFKSGQVSATISPKTSAEIYADTILNDPACFTQLYVNPAVKNPSATCNLVPDCVTEMTSKLAGGPVSADKRAQFLTEMAIYNCLETPADFYQIIPAVCSLILADVLKINSDTPFPPNTFTNLNLYLEKVLVCGTYGYPEFYPEAAIIKLMQLIQWNGAIKTSGTESEEEQEKLTAQQLTLMISYLRMIVEA